MPTHTVHPMRHRRGFTLMEVLVIIAVLAALAAILVPTVGNQARRADIGRVTGDLEGLRTGIEAFVVDVHRWPGDVDDLAAPIAGTDADIDGDPYPPRLLARWDGPYIDRVVADDGTAETGFGARLQDDFATTEYPAGSGIRYLTARIYGLAAPEAAGIDAALDDGDGLAAGRFRHFTPGDSARFLALPID